MDFHIVFKENLCILLPNLPEAKKCSLKYVIQIHGRRGHFSLRYTDFELTSSEYAIVNFKKLENNENYRLISEENL